MEKDITVEIYEEEFEKEPIEEILKKFAKQIRFYEPKPIRAKDVDDSLDEEILKIIESRE